MRWIKKCSAKFVLGILIVVVGVAIKPLLVSLVSEDGHVESPLINGMLWTLAVVVVGCGVLVSVVRWEKLRKGLINGAVIVCSLIFCLVVLEVVLRLFPAAANTKPSLSLFTPNPNRTGSYRLKPNLRSTLHIAGMKVAISTNADGMHWREVSHDKPSGKQRIAFLGDSFTFGCWVDSVANSFVGVFESLLDTSRYEALNFGVGGYGLFDFRVQLTEQVFAYEPDYVFVMFFNGNDIQDTYLDVSRYRIVNGVALVDSQRVREAVPEEFAARTEPGVPPGGSLRTIALLWGLHDALHAMLVNADVIRVPPRPFTTDNRFFHSNFWSRKRLPPFAKQAVDTTLRALEDVIQICRDHHVTPVIVAVPTSKQVYAGQPEGEEYSISLPQDYVRGVAERHSVPFLDLLPILRSYSIKEKRNTFWSIDPHFNQNGHYVTGLALASFFEGIVSAAP